MYNIKWFLKWIVYHKLQCIIPKCTDKNLFTHSLGGIIGIKEYKLILLNLSIRDSNNGYQRIGCANKFWSSMMIPSILMPLIYPLHFELPYKILFEEKIPLLINFGKQCFFNVLTINNKSFIPRQKNNRCYIKGFCQWLKNQSILLMLSLLINHFEAIDF